MKATKTAKQRIKSELPWFTLTVEIYRKAVAFLANVVRKEWEAISKEKSVNRVNLVEKLVHRSRKSPNPKYDFDDKFPKFPSFLRRRAIQEAIGYVSSFMSRLERSRKNKKVGCPAWNSEPKVYPAFYKGNMWEYLANGKVRLKLWNGKEWLWYEVEFQPIEKLSERFGDAKMQSPGLVVKNGRAWLCIPFEKSIKPNRVYQDCPVLAVDLGVNHFAVCSVVASDGTVLGRHFIDLPREKDRLWKLAGHIAKKASQTKILEKGFAGCYWRKMRAISNYVAHVVSKRLVEIAVQYDCAGIVFERLGKRRVKGRGAKKLRRKLRAWLYGKVQKFTRYKAYWHGIGVRRVNPKGTSRYAFDGSGEVERFNNARLARFPSGKIYNADLSASYNIGARFWVGYWTRKVEKTKVLGETPGCSHRAKDPGGNRRPPLVLASLISLVREGSFSVPRAFAHLSPGRMQVSTETTTKVIA